MAAHLDGPPGAGAIQLLSFVTPAWLLGLALLPLIRWLHRGGRHRRAVPVSHLGLWRGSQASPPAAGERRPPDPAWRRRALLAALLFVALAEPQWPVLRTRLTLWVDDSLSMLTREEAQGTRLALALAQVALQLAAMADAEVEVRALSDPWRSLGALTAATTSTLIAGAGRQAASAPPAALLRADRLHWLVSDGAHPAVLQWPGDRRPDRIFQVADVTRNVGLERLSARRSASDPDRLDLLLKLSNGGSVVETRELVFFTDKGEIARSTQRLEPGASVMVKASIPMAARVRASLQPGDALAEDDEIALDLAPLRRLAVALDSKCPKALLAAVSAHPALALAREGSATAQAALDCGTSGAAGLATLRVVAQHAPTRLQGPLQWSSAVAESQRVALDAQALQVAGRLQASPTDTVLLAAGDAPLIVSRPGSAKLIETAIDFEATAIARGPEIPLLVNLMFERLLGQPLLDAIALTDRGAGAAWVVPSKHLDTQAGTAVANDAQPRRDLARPLLMLALLVLLWEIFALGRQWRLLSGPGRAGLT